MCRRDPVKCIWEIPAVTTLRANRSDGQQIQGRTGSMLPDILGGVVADDGVYAVQENGYEKGNTRVYGPGSLARSIC